MTAKTRTQLQSIFANDQIPTASGFADLFDSFIATKDTGNQTVQSSMTIDGGLAVSATANFSGPTTFNGPITIDSEFIATATARFNGPVVRSADADVSAQGSTQNTAYVAQGRFVAITSGAATQGVILTPAISGDNWRVFNRTTNNILVYPATAANLDGEAVNAAITVSASAAIEVYYVSDTTGFTIRGT